MNIFVFAQKNATCCIGEQNKMNETDSRQLGALVDKGSK